MIQNGFKGLFVLLFLVFSNISAVVHRKNEGVEQVDKNQLQSIPNTSEANIKNEGIRKSASKSRQRMSAGKIAGMVALVLLGAAVIGALLGGIILPFVIGPIICLFS